MTILWLIERLLTKPVDGSNTDVVITADWRCNGTDQNYNGTCYGSCSFAPPTGSFTPYADLTEQQVLDWCYAAGVDKSAIEANVTLQIENQIHPPVVVLPLPWIEIVPPLIPQRVPSLVANDEPVADAPAA